MSGRRRLTVSLLLSGRVAAEVDGMRRGLGAGALERIPPHVTLVPPVNLREEDLPGALEVVRAAASSVPPLRLELGPPESFLPVTPVLYLAVAGDLGDLAALRHRLLDGPLAPPPGREEREFVAHVTLDQHIATERATAALSALASYRAVTTVSEVTVLQFEESEARWKPIAGYGLGASRVVGRGGVELSIETGSLLDPIAAAFTDGEWDAYGAATFGDSDEERAFAIVARSGGEIVGTASGQIRPGLLRLANLIVAAHMRRLGVGAQLMKEVERLASESGASRVRLETRVGSTSEDFYRRLGYEATSLLPEWRHGYDFLVMERAVTPGGG